jgi:type I restriction enzyme, S subunit
VAKESKSAVVPRLRFPEFRGSTEWNAECVDKLYSFMRNNAFSRDKLNYESGTAKNVHYGDIHTRFSALFDVTKERVPFVNGTEEVPDAGSDDYCVEGDIILADASEDTNDVGKCIEVVRLDGQLLLAGQHTILARRKSNALIVGLGGHLFRSARIRSQIQKEAQGSKVYAISPTRLAGVEIAYPGDKKEQQKITECLTSLDEVIAAQGRKVEALKTHKRGLMQQLFPREGETLPRLRLPDFRDAPSWAGSTLAGIASISSGSTPLRSELSFFSGGTIPWVKTTDLNNSFIEVTEECLTTKARATVNPVGSILVAMYGGFNQIGRTGYLRMPSATNQALSVLRADRERVRPIYLLFWLNAKVEDWKRIASSSRKDPNITSMDVARFPIKVPSIAEQERIADCLCDLEAHVAAESKKLDALKTHKKGLMQQLFPAPAEV